MLVPEWSHCSRGRVRGSSISRIVDSLARPRERYTVLTRGPLYWTDARDPSAALRGAARLVTRARLICRLRRVRIPES